MLFQPAEMNLYNNNNNNNIETLIMFTLNHQMVLFSEHSHEH